MFTILDAFFDGSQKFDFGNAAIIALVSILIVFTILALIIGITHLLFDAIDRVGKRIESKKPVKAEVKQEVVRQPVVIKDDDMMAAVLVATIDYQNEIKKGVRVVSVKEIN